MFLNRFQPIFARFVVAFDHLNSTTKEDAGGDEHSSKPPLPDDVPYDPMKILLNEEEKHRGLRPLAGYSVPK